MPDDRQAFMAASPADQHAFLSQMDPGYAKASGEEQSAYLASLKGQTPTPEPLPTIPMTPNRTAQFARGVHPALTSGGAIAGGAMASPGVLTTPLGAGLGAGVGEGLGKISDQLMFGDAPPTATEAARDEAIQGGLAAGTEGLFQGIGAGANKIGQLEYQAPKEWKVPWGLGKVVRKGAPEAEEGALPAIRETPFGNGNIPPGSTEEEGVRLLNKPILTPEEASRADQLIPRQRPGETIFDYQARVRGLGKAGRTIAGPGAY